MNILLLFIIIPVITVIGIMFCKGLKQVRWVSAVGMGGQLITSIVVCLLYLAERKAGNTAEMLFTASYEWFDSLNICFDIGVDGISVAMLMLTAFVIFSGVFASWDMEDLHKEFFIFLILLSTGVFGFFISLDLFVMFLFYELAVIPMYLLIGIWGSGPKEYSAMKLTLMLMGGSALMLVGLFGLYFNSAPDEGELTFNFLKISEVDLPLSVQRFFFPFTFIGFGVLGALFPLHTWSPDGHSSAPTAVSMLHAGVLMKLGGYGCLRIAVFLMPEAAKEMAWIFLIANTISIVYGALGAIWKYDLKYVNAYSSISHCGIVLFGVLFMTQATITGAVIQMISHGLMCALFFGLIGMIYSRTHTRMINEMGGIMKFMPFLGSCYIIGGLASLGLPGLSGFVAEMTTFTGAFQYTDPFHRVITIISLTCIVITAVYILRLLGIMLFGPITKEHYLHPPLTDAKWYERVSDIVLLVGIIGIGVAPLWLSNMIRDSVLPIIEKIY